LRILDWSLLKAPLFAAIISSTDAAAPISRLCRHSVAKIVPAIKIEGAANHPTIIEFNPAGIEVFFFG
jgi:NhaP-type Na+/H+ and K+/H+ antiporter